MSFRYVFVAALASLLMTPAPVPAQDQAQTSERWSSERAQQWWNERPWPCGFNYVPGNSVSYTQMWMEDAFDPALIDRELASGQQIGFNCVRVVLSFVVWEAEPEAFKKRFDQFLEVCFRRGMQVLPCFFDDCVFGDIIDPQFGPQPRMIKGWYANGWTPNPGHQRVKDPAVRPALERFVKDILTAHRSDKRILLWDLYNEPTNAGMGMASMPLLQDVFRWAREVNPSQPISSGVWGGEAKATEFMLAQSDIITFHNYSPGAALRANIADLKRHGQPLICTEWLNRPKGSTVSDCLPVFVEQKVGAVHWGLVNGKTQTHLHWGARPGHPPPNVWQHDLFHGNGTAYDPAEIRMFRDAIQQAKKP